MNKIKPFTLPNYISYLALLFSLASILLILNGNFYLSLGAALLAFMADTLDGFIARKLKQESDFGRQFDSFTDVFIFLIYPGLVYYIHFNLEGFISLTVLYFFILTGVYRLVRFNLIGYTEDKRIKGYPGLPVFSSYLTLALIYIASTTLNEPAFKVVSLILIGFQSFLMTRTFVFPKPDKTWPLVIILAALSFYMFYLGLN